MSYSVKMNGTDYMMSVFDHHLRDIGSSGNICHISLVLSSMPDVEALKQRLKQVAVAFPVIASRQSRGFTLLPRRKVPLPDSIRLPELRLLTPENMNGLSVDVVRADVMNDRLDDANGELIRFSLIETGDYAEVIMSWSHTLMDAHGAEAFLGLVADSEKTHLPDNLKDQQKENTRRVFNSAGILREMKQAWKALRHLDKIGNPPPLSIHTLRANRAGTKQASRFFAFTKEETEIVRKNSLDKCGFLGETNYYLAVTLMELKNLCAVCGVSAENYVVNLPADARDKGSRQPIFSNFSSFVMYSLLKEQVSNLDTAINSLQKQTREALKNKTGMAFESFSNLVRFFPSKTYWDRMKLSLNGELASMFFANTGVVSSSLEHFMGCEVMHFRHATSITAPPGIGVFFYAFKSCLCCTVGYLEGVMSEKEVAGFMAGLRDRLLVPESRTRN